MLNCCPSSPVPISTPAILGARAGGSHFTSADDTTCADEGSDDPKPHSASPSRWSPTTLTTPTPADGPVAGCTENTTAAGWYANSTLLVLNPPSDALTSTVTTPEG